MPHRDPAARIARQRARRAVCPRCGAEVHYHRTGEPVALCGWPLAPCATRMPGEWEREAVEGRPRRSLAKVECEELARCCG